MNKCINVGTNVEKNLFPSRDSVRFYFEEHHENVTK